MENREYQILSEIREMISSVRAQLDALEAKVAQLSQDAVTEVLDDTPIDLDIEDVFDDIPVVLFYPGEYTGQSLTLFNEFADDNYYRAFNLL